MSFRDRMDAAERTAASFRAGDITRDAAQAALRSTFQGTAMTEGAVQSFLNDWLPGPARPWVVIEIENHAAGTRVRAFGPHATREEAEQSRRRIHLDHALEGRGLTKFWPPKTYVAEVEPETKEGGS